MNLNKLGVYLGILTLGVSAGFWSSRYLRQPTTIVQKPSTYSNTIPTLSPGSNFTNLNQNVNFIAQAVQKVGPAVVRIDAARPVSSAIPEQFKQPFFHRFFGSDQSAPEKVERGTGSGFIVSADGRLLTNAHVVEGTDRVQVTLKDGQIYDGEVLGVDLITDIAVVKIEGTNLPTVTFGDGNNLTPGEWAIAIGNPLGLDNTVTVGIISAIDRSSSQVGVPDKRVKFIQTDAAINPGNSGGPLLNAEGEVIGINTAIRADAQGLGFAIPIETAQRIANQLFTKGKADHPYLGIHMITLNPKTKEEINLNSDYQFDVTEEEGVLVVRVVPQSPAAKAGLQAGDVISKVGNQPVETANHVQEQVETSEIGTALEVEIIRNGTIKVVEVRPGAFPQSEFE
ncbi:HtrA2 peptidase [Stanieria cyanosphaera PCC 7437]|uniref:HtrA2 peptidase n=1 Tax=Stanieria cyanosphaera (strain ATCC 29371 / PCC 7437) TaxID=111780 RepID=K9XXT0_STAC7|nr:HhoA/HhoB/HtrA family serine endopeptidase [Stanieria cyanosphaera]AFZ36864.1 HtrA2 peptidase [Stanieria cyanosphaera PCC 7437]